MLHKIVNTIFFKGDSEQESIRLNTDSELKKELEHMLFVMVYADAINLRALLKYYSKYLPLAKDKRIEEIQTRRLLIALILDAIVEIFGNLFEVKIALEKCVRYSMANNIDTLRNKKMVDGSIALMAHIFGKKEQGEFSLEYSANIKFKVKYELRYSNRISVESVQFLDENEEEFIPNMFVMCLKALDLLESKGYFK